MTDASRGAAGVSAPFPYVDPTRELVAAIQELSLARTLPKIQEIVRKAARNLTGADGATFVLREGGNCHYADEDAISPLWKGQRFPLEDCISGWAMLNRRPAVIEDIYADERIPHQAYRPTFVKSLAMIPIRSSEPVGAIGNYWAKRHRPTDREVGLLQALADSTAVAMENVLLYERLEEERVDSLRKLARVAEFRDDASGSHAERVGRLSGLVAAQLGLPSREAELIQHAAPLHDIGKVAIADSILLKPAKLDEEEFAEIRKHPAVGAEILAGSNSDVLCLAEQIALGHHERWDGSGYPAGVSGNAIPVASRIVAIVDSFDALTHDRPYRRARSVASAREEIQCLSGSHFDPEVARAFEQLDPIPA